MMLEYITQSPAETESVGRALAERLLCEGRMQAVIALRGDLGVGKTAFTRGFASALGLRNVKSPTYTVVNEHRGTHVLYHFDMYRIEDEDDLYSIGFDEYLADEAFCLIEWSERIPEALPDDCLTVSIERTDGDTPDQRRITISTEDV